MVYPYNFLYYIIYMFNLKLISIVYRNSDLLTDKDIKFKELISNINFYEKYVISYNNINYTINKSIINNNYYLLYIVDGNTSIIIVISKNKKVAEIHIIKNYKKIAIYNTNQYVNSKIFLIIFKFLKKYKKILKINLLTLFDNSKFFCSNNKELIASKANALLTGDTWFGQYGFRAYSYCTYKQIENDDECYEANKKMFLNLTITDVNLLKYINKTNNDVLIDVAKKTLIEKPNMLLKDFLKYLLINYDENADEFYKYYENIYDDNSGYNTYYRMIGLKL